MTGQWTKKRSEKHDCAKPTYAADVSKGDEWTCECGRVWRVKDIIGPDQREPDIKPYLWWIQVLT